MKTFDELWRDLEERSRRWAIPIVQDYKELEYVFNLIKGCKSYLEVGTAEGNGLYVLSNALADNSCIRVVDFGEKHTKAARDEATGTLQTSNYFECLDNSHSKKAMNFALADSNYEVVFIDAGHSYEDVIADSAVYAPLATKYVIFHDIQMPPVKAAVEWYLKQNPQFKYHEFINSTTYGYGIIEV